MKSADFFVYIKYFLYLCTRKGASRPFLSDEASNIYG